MVDTWQPSKGVLFFYLKYKEGEATRRFFWGEQLGFLGGGVFEEAGGLKEQRAFFLGKGIDLWAKGGYH